MQGLNSNDVLFGVVRARCSASVNLVDLSPGEHMDGILNWANGMADGATCAILFYNLREGAITFKLNCLVA
jgi:hypothetical protein